MKMKKRLLSLLLAGGYSAAGNPPDRKCGGNPKLTAGLNGEPEQGGVCRP